MPGSICSLKGLKNLMQLVVLMGLKQGAKSGIKEGVMETWLEMRPFGYG